MRTARIKVSSRVQAATYHCMSRTTGRVRIFKEEEKRFIRETAYAVADFCGVQLLTYALMENHPHLFAHVPHWIAAPDDAEIVRRYRVLHPKLSVRKEERLMAMVEELKQNTPDGQDWRQRQLRQMGDISEFMKIFKQRITTWFNKRHNRIGTIWAERFTSVLVEDYSGALLPIAVYIDLNPVRAGIVRDPKDYPYCGYAAAVAGHLPSQLGIMRVMEATTWAEAQPEYRKLLFAVATIARESGQVLPESAFDAVEAKGGKLSLMEVLGCRIRHFTNGGVLGRKAFVAEHLEAFRQRHRRKRRTPPRPLPFGVDWRPPAEEATTPLVTLRNVRTGSDG